MNTVPIPAKPRNTVVMTACSSFVLYAVEAPSQPPFARQNIHLARTAWMTDIVDSATRSAIMSRIPSENTRPELIVRRTAHALGFRFRIHRRELPGCPDVVFPRYRAVIMVHGSFWHRHPGCRFASRPSTRVEYWEEKFTQTVDRDRRTQAALCNLGWRVLIIWECETKDHNLLAESIVSYLRQGNQTYPASGRMTLFANTACRTESKTAATSAEGVKNSWVKGQWPKRYRRSRQ